MMAVDVVTGKIHWTLGGPGKGTRRGGWNVIEAEETGMSTS